MSRYSSFAGTLLCPVIFIKRLPSRLFILQGMIVRGLHSFSASILISSFCKKLLICWLLSTACIYIIIGLRLKMHASYHGPFTPSPTLRAPTEPIDIFVDVPAVGGEIQLDSNTRTDAEQFIFNKSEIPTIAEFYGSEDMKYPLLVDMPHLVARLSSGLPPPKGVKPINKLRSPWLIRRTSAATGGCNGSEYLLVLVKSHPNNFANRAAIRTSWATTNCWKLPVKVFFLLGVSTQSKAWVPMLEKEESCHRDLLVRNFIDHYYNNTIKLMSAIEWADDHCTKTSFVVFIDDDFALNPRATERFLTLVAASPAYQRFIGGWVWRQATPLRRTIYNGGSKWDVSFAEYPWSTYPPYVAAGAMFVSRPVLRSIRVAMQYTRYFRFDDIFIGFVLHKLSLTPVHMDMAMSYKPLPLNCTNAELVRLVATHGYRDPIDQLQMWYRIVDATNLTC